jgi:four helix bundle protein
MLIAKSSTKRDFDFCKQISRSASSVTSNLAEGFACYKHRESARYARIAKASLTETHNHLRDGVDRGYWTREEIQPVMTLANRATGATTRWMLYLLSSETP